MSRRFDRDDYFDFLMLSALTICIVALFVGLVGMTWSLVAA